MSIATVGDTDALSFNELTDQVATLVMEDGFDKLILDLRENGGGNNTLSERLRRVIATSRYNAPGSLYVLTSPRTFSAAVNIAARFERDTFAVFIGEPTGAGPNHFGDATIFMGEDSGIPVMVSTLRWQDGVPLDHRIAIMPDQFAPLTFADWVAGNDLALAAALAHRENHAAVDLSWYFPWARASQSEDRQLFWRQ